MLKRQSLLDTWDRSLVDWFVIFEHGDMPWRWARLLAPGFRHCYAVRWDGFNWIRLNPRMGHTDIEILEFGKFDSIADIVQDTNCCAILRCRVWRETMRIRAPWPTVATCVEQIKAILGIRKWFLWTPLQLFNYLRGRKHGQLIFITQTTRENRSAEEGREAGRGA